MSIFPAPPRRFAAVAFFVAALPLLAGAAAVSAIQDPPQEPPKRGTAGRKYKNLKVLRDLPDEQFLPLMNEWNAALGVHCQACHVQEKTEDGRTVVAWEKDGNPLKEAARQMHLLTVDLNAKQPSIEGKATCYMCHQGRVVPITKKPPAAPAKPAPAKPTRPARRGR